MFPAWEELLSDELDAVWAETLIVDIERDGPSLTNTTGSGLDVYIDDVFRYILTLNNPAPRQTF